jgi:hypothetical protein
MYQSSFNVSWAPTDLLDIQSELKDINESIGSALEGLRFENGILTLVTYTELTKDDIDNVASCLLAYSNPVPIPVQKYINLGISGTKTDLSEFRSIYAYDYKPEANFYLKEYIFGADFVKNYGSEDLSFLLRVVDYSKNVVLGSTLITETSVAYDIISSVDEEHVFNGVHTLEIQVKRLSGSGSIHIVKATAVLEQGDGNG